MPRAPSYTVRNADGLYCFRIRVPRDLIPVFEGQRFIRRSLRTHRRQTAVARARRLAVVWLDQFKLERQQMKARYEFDLALVQSRQKALKARLKEIEDSLTWDQWEALDGPEGALDDDLSAKWEEAKQISAKLDTLPDEGTLQRKVEIAKDIEIRAEVEADYGINHNNPAAKESDPGPLFSALWPEYKEDRFISKIWDRSNKKTIRRADGYFKDFIEILGGDMPVRNFGPSEAKQLLGGLVDYPMKRRQVWKDYPLSDIPKDAPRLKDTTARERLRYYKPFFKWMLREKIIDWNPLDGREIQAEHDEHPTPTKNDIEDWYHLPQHLISEPWEFWCPRIALFTGMRQGEVAELYATDVREDPDTGIWYFDVYKDGIKRTKNYSSNRQIPVPNILIEKGFLDYLRKVQEMYAAEHPGWEKRSLWPGLVIKSGSRGGKLGDNWSSLKNKHGVLREPRTSDGREKVFHGLRRIIINRLPDDAGVDEITIDSITGHKPKMGTQRRYRDRIRTLPQKKEAIDKLVVDGVSWEHPAKFKLPSN